MRFFWITYQVILGYFDVQWHPVHENLADYYTKHFDDEHNMEVSPGCLQKNNSPIFLPIYEAPIALQGCVVIMLYKYIYVRSLYRESQLGTQNGNQRTNNGQTEYQLALRHINQ